MDDPLPAEPHPHGRAWPRVVGLGAATALWWALHLVAPGRRVTLASGDLRRYFLPLYAAFYGRMAAGRLPLWNPYQLCGIPWLGTVQGGFFYPAHVLYLLFPTGTGLALSSVAHLVLLALSTMAFARAAGLGAPAAAVSGLLFTLRGEPTSWLFWPPMLEAGAWLPVGCIGVLRIARGETRRGMALLSLAAGASLLAGFPQVTVYLGYAWSALLLAFLLGATPSAGRLTAAGGFAAALALGALLAAAALVPGFEMVRVATRPAAGIPVALMYQMGFYGGARLAGDAISGGEGSFSALALCVAPAALLTRRHRALALWSLVLGALAFCFALGPVTPLFPLYDALPGVGAFRKPSRILVLTDLCLALLAGIGCDALARRATSAGSGLSRLRPVAIPLACALLLTAHLTSLGAVLPALVAAGAAAALLASARVSPGAAAGALVVLAAVEVLVPPHHFERLPYDAAAAADYGTFRDVYVALARAEDHDRAWIVPMNPIPALTPKLAGIYRMRSIDDYEDVNLRRQAEYFTYAMEGATVSPSPRGFFQGRIVPPPPRDGRSPLAERQRLLDLAAVRLIAIHETYFRLPEVTAFAAQAALVPARSPGGRMRLFENPHAMPRAFVVYRTRPAPPPDELLARLSAPDFDPLVESYVEGEPGLVVAADAPARGAPATFVRDEEEVVELEATLTAPGLVVLADSFYSGWRATVDGMPAPILATNHLFRGVPAPAGQHRVRFEYRPWTVPEGLLGSAAGVVVLAALLFRR